MRRNRLIALSALLACFCLAGSLVAGRWVVALLSKLYDVPTRVGGRFEKRLYLLGRPFALDPHGGRLAYYTPRSGNGDIWTIELAGSRNSPFQATPVSEGNPAWSPDGSFFAFSKETNYCGHIWVTRNGGGTAKQLTFGDDYDFAPTICPNGKEVWFSRIPLGSNPTRFSAFRIPTGGGTAVEVNTCSGRLIGDDFTFLPNAKGVYFTGNHSGVAGGIERLDVATGEIHKVVDGTSPAIDRGRGITLVYVTGDGRTDIRVADVDGKRSHLVYHSNTSKLQVEMTSERGPIFFFEEDPDSFGAFISEVNVSGSGYKRIVKAY